MLKRNCPGFQVMCICALPFSSVASFQCTDWNNWHASEFLRFPFPSVSLCLCIQQYKDYPAEGNIVIKKMLHSFLFICPKLEKYLQKLKQQIAEDPQLMHSSSNKIGVFNTSGISHSGQNSSTLNGGDVINLRPNKQRTKKNRNPFSSCSVP